MRAAVKTLIRAQQSCEKVQHKHSLEARRRVSAGRVRVKVEKSGRVDANSREIIKSKDKRWRFKKRMFVSGLGKGLEN